MDYSNIKSKLEEIKTDMDITKYVKNIGKVSGIALILGSLAVGFSPKEVKARGEWEAVGGALAGAGISSCMHTQANQANQQREMKALQYQQQQKTERLERQLQEERLRREIEREYSR